jgi:hypothetical protein
MRQANRKEQTARAARRDRCRYRRRTHPRLAKAGRRREHIRLRGSQSKAHTLKHDLRVGRQNHPAAKSTNLTPRPHRPRPVQRGDRRRVGPRRIRGLLLTRVSG